MMSHVISPISTRYVVDVQAPPTGDTLGTWHFNLIRELISTRPIEMVVTVSQYDCVSVPSKDDLAEWLLPQFPGDIAMGALVVQDVIRHLKLDRHPGDLEIDFGDYRLYFRSPEIEPIRPRYWEYSIGKRADSYFFDPVTGSWHSGGKPTLNEIMDSYESTVPNEVVAGLLQQLLQNFPGSLAQDPLT